MQWDSSFRIKSGSESQGKSASVPGLVWYAFGSTSCSFAARMIAKHCKPFFGWHIYRRLDKILIKLWPKYSEVLVWTQKNGHIWARHIRNLLVIICKIGFFGCYQFPDQRETDQFQTHTHWYRSKISGPPEILIHPKHHQQDKLINQFCRYVFPCPASC